MDVIEKLLYPIYQAAILAAIGLYFLSSRRYRRGGFLVLISVLWLLLCATPALATFLCGPLERQFPIRDASAYPKADAIVILGGGVLKANAAQDVDDPFGPTTRMGFGLQLYRAGRAGVILVSGNDQARAMAARLQQQGVPAAALRVEDRSANTHQNALFSADMLKRENLQRVLLVTSGFHMPRASGAFAGQGLQVIPATAYDPVYASWAAHPWWPRRAALRLTGRCLHEYVAMWWYRWRGWA